MISDKVIITRDGSSTILNKETGEHYHSTFGAIQESEHVFIQSGLETFGQLTWPIAILEVGFGTGLNAMLALKWAEEHKIHIDYMGIEAFPISGKLVLQTCP